MEFTVVDPEEKSVNDRVDKMMGNDTNLATIVKMALMPDSITAEKRDYVLGLIKKANEKESKHYKNEFKLAYDCAGNLIEVNTIQNGGSAETDSGSILHEPERSS
jgi:hypothetical protein